MKNDKLQYRHIGIRPEDEKAMLETIGVNDLDELIDKAMPTGIRLHEPLHLPKAMTEREYADQTRQRSARPADRSIFAARRARPARLLRR